VHANKIRTERGIFELREVLKALLGYSKRYVSLHGNLLLS